MVCDLDWRKLIIVNHGVGAPMDTLAVSMGETALVLVGSGGTTKLLA